MKTKEKILNQKTSVGLLAQQVKPTLDKSIQVDENFEINPTVLSGGLGFNQEDFLLSQLNFTHPVKNNSLDMSLSKNENRKRDDHPLSSHFQSKSLKKMGENEHTLKNIDNLSLNSFKLNQQQQLVKNNNPKIKVRNEKNLNKLLVGSYYIDLFLILIINSLFYAVSCLVLNIAFREFLILVKQEFITFLFLFIVTYLFYFTFFDSLPFRSLGKNLMKIDFVYQDLLLKRFLFSIIELFMIPLFFIPLLLNIHNLLGKKEIK